jgi:hypothetical protein
MFLCSIYLNIGADNQYLTDVGFRGWLQRKFSIGLGVFWGRWGTLIPYQVPLYLEVATIFILCGVHVGHIHLFSMMSIRSALRSR